MDFKRFAVDVASLSRGMLEAKERHPTHWQIWKDKQPLIDVWPGTRRYRKCGLAPGTKSESGDQYVALDVAIATLRKIPFGKTTDNGTVKVTLSREYLDELKSKVEHGFNLLNEEARHLFAHAGILIPKHRRCPRCNAEGAVTDYDIRTKFACDLCGGKGYDPPRTKSTSDTQTLQWKLKTDGRWMARSEVKTPSFTNWWVVSVTDAGLFDISYSDFKSENVDCFKTLKEAQEYCQRREYSLIDVTEAASDY